MSEMWNDKTRPNDFWKNCKARTGMNPAEFKKIYGQDFTPDTVILSMKEYEALKQRIKELEQENKRLLDLAAMDTLDKSQKKRDLEQQAKGVEGLFIQHQSEDMVEVWEIGEYARQLRKQAQEMK